MAADKDSEAWRAAAFTCSITKPLRQPDLHQCLRSLDRGDGLCTPIQSSTEADDVPAVQFTAEVLVAEDNAVNQDLVEEALNQPGCRVAPVDEGNISEIATASRFGSPSISRRYSSDRPAW